MAVVKPFRVGAYGFDLWDGPPPALAQEQIATHTRPGADGVGQLKLGSWAPTTEAVLLADFTTFTAADAMFAFWATLPDQDPLPVRWNNIEYFNAYGHLHHVDAVEKLQVQRHVRLTGPGYDYVGGARIAAKFVFTAYDVRSFVNAAT